MTTSDYLTQLQQDRDDLVDNLTEKGITGLTGEETFTELVPEVLNIPSGGSEGWQRPSDWWDTKTILENAENRVDDNGATVYPAYIILLDDSDKKTTFSKSTSNKSLQGDSYLTSDGQWYGTTNATHTWDETKDKACSEGYKTRYVLVYTKTPTTTLAISVREFLCLEIVLGEFACSVLCRENYKLRNIVGNSNTQISFVNYMFYDIPALENIYLPNLTNVQSLYKCYSLKNVYMPDLITMATNNMFIQENYCLQKITLPSSLTTIPTLSNGSFGQRLKAIILPQDFALNINLTGETSLTHSALVDIIDKLKDLTGTEETHTITLGATNEAKLSADELAVITSKGWTLGS